jgi:FAD/FMN-containing dehydrogenase
MSRRRSRFLLALAAVGIIGLGFVTKPAVYLARTSWNDRDETIATPEGAIDDASRLNATLVKEIWPVPADADNAKTQLATLLRRASAEGLPVSIAGARHSMGGHTIASGGVVLDMRPWNQMQLDADRNLLHVQSGATWEEIIPYLDRHGKSVAVMQSNNSFSVGGSLSVNCHGWAYNQPPIASTVASFRLMKPTGEIVRCRRDENPELFSLVLGGYGLFGVILDAELRVVPNARYQLRQFVVPVEEALATFEREVEGRSGVGMAYARMNITPDHFLDEVIINAFFEEAGPIPPLADSGNVKLRRTIFRGSAESDYGKELRWSAETKLQPWLASEAFSRNQLFNESADVFRNRSASSTDILHEYFVPRDQVVEFVTSLQRIVPQHKANLLNVTVRSVETDPDTFLRYADESMMAFVMLFVQETTPAGEARMQALTRDLIDAALACGGRYYLPYRLHATSEQFRAAYPQAEAFFAAKREHDPHELFQNQFYLRYR